ncbi:hypothetical protein P3T73_16555 [Kiritimatiellota bacterium B12222]|nr:hypothetical protein P3T73_16555 [Kiritimatiellota bacterium B12222]
MSVHPLHDALHTVRTLRRSLLQKERFKGWSGPTRIFSGTLALVAALISEQGWIPQTNRSYLILWALVFLSAVILNVGALTYWFLNDRMIQRDTTRLKPILDVVPPLAVGALFTLVLILQRNLDPLYGVWMCMFGLTNFASRYVLPTAIAFVGIFYIAAGALCLLMPEITFLHPLAMGLVFCAGEWAGGTILYVDDRRYAAFSRQFATPDED